MRPKFESRAAWLLCSARHLAHALSGRYRADQIFDTWKQKSEVNPDTRRRAIVIAGHDMERIERLLEIARRNNPERTEQWYWEKILYDMERDRGV